MYISAHSFNSICTHIYIYIQFEFLRDLIFFCTATVKAQGRKRESGWWAGSGIHSRSGGCSNPRVFTKSDRRRGPRLKSSCGDKVFEKKAAKFWFPKKRGWSLIVGCCYICGGLSTTVHHLPDAALNACSSSWNWGWWTKLGYNGGSARSSAEWALCGHFNSMGTVTAWFRMGFPCVSW